MVSKRLFLTLLIGLASLPAQASLNVFACEPEWADLAGILVPEARMTVATSAYQDPHYIEARPSLIAAMRNADIAVCTGASLEAGWLPSLLRKAANRDIQPGRPGLFFAADQVPLHQPHDHVDRSMGDVHPEGNPHVHLDPDALPRIADALAERLASISPEQATDIQRRLLQWKVRWNLSKAEWRDKADDLKGMTVGVQHSGFHYLLRWLDVDVAFDLEPKPGLPPSASHLNAVLQDPDLPEASAIMVALYQDDRPAHWLSERTHLPVLVLPGTVTGKEAATSLESLLSHLVNELHQLAPKQTVESDG
ncbi:zinc ABC transporter substrate-binding protein [Marinobacter sp. NP-4(2019)]|uniref:metal ABC transporter substrate-binding protein n=1 Tax=Marinobacter sp. NP-4(2019) TaxID=2488665 RepID=UPI000FC3D677|nr:zinc ABC transporter substrate-binding protein [Marinobacter sp. NP-4(2019)]AZT82434.1 zinc ABC transporter substrate-binding protein [Marinobacter sp. NP-4(2019)]